MSVFVPLGSATSTTASDMIEETRRHLGAGSGETLNQITATDETQTTVTLSRPLANITPGTVLSVGLEQMYVWGYSQPDRTCDVLRGHGGSEAAAHDADTIVRIGGPHSDFAILQALNGELRSMSGGGIFAPRYLDLTVNDLASTYDLAPDVLDVYAVLLDTDTVTNEWPEVRSWVFRPGSSAAEFPSGNSLRLDTLVPSGRTMRVLYKAPLAPLAGLDDNVETTTGLLPSAHDIPPIGAAWRLAMPEEYRRNQTHRQGDSRRAEEVPPGAKLRSGAGLAQMRATRRQEEVMNLARLWPSRARHSDALAGTGYS